MKPDLINIDNYKAIINNKIEICNSDSHFFYNFIILFLFIIAVGIFLLYRYKKKFTSF